ncbi:Rhamnogalacturonyl hydrolase YesR [Microbulbifer thermotolerans]|uniref:glycoside hydrolase family 88 protein n=1 Tax=Microbulbifer thermotolerans TaxID=252514 RepID=UPI0008E91975|nr:glycoside hydrolase family 88 protein [Microbulbifer thermotolerans]SFC40185.1 Rhamnogalacturonyl hydrolase YesR [Microbulbifer thermotolerans]
MKRFGISVCKALPITLAALMLGACGEEKAGAQKEEALQALEQPLADKIIARLQLSNPSDFPRLDEAVYLSFRELGLADNYAHPLAVKGKTLLPVQRVDRDADGSIDGVIFLVDIQVDETLDLQILPAIETVQPEPKRTQAEISHKSGGRWVGNKYEGGSFQNVSTLDVPPEHTDHSYFIRYEGPGIESDLVGYRVYLDWRNGFDIFGKKVREPVLQDVGQDGFDSYHQMADWGMDILKVGDALGIGGYGYWDGEKVVRVSDVQNWSAKILDNGNLYSAFSIKYQGWKPDEDLQADLTAVMSIAAGSRLVEVRGHTDRAIGAPVAGIVKHPGTQLIVGDLDIPGSAWTYIGTWGRQSLDGSDLGMGLLVQKKFVREITEDEHNRVVVFKEPATHEFNYYFTAAWAGEGESRHGPITSAEDFERYLAREAEKRTIPLRKRLTTAVSEAQTQQPLSAEVALAWSKRMADSELERSALQLGFGGVDPHRKRPAYFEYTTGLLMQAYDDLNQVSPDARYAAAVEKVMGSFVNEDGSINGYVQSKFNIDSINAGKVLLRMYERNGKEQYQTAVDTLREQLKQHPRTDAGAFWHKKIYPHQVWLDGVYMGIPFLAHYEKLRGQGDFEEVLAEFRVVREKLRDPRTGLYFHGWDEVRNQVWADDKSGLSPNFWSRGMGWMAMALVDVLDYLPEENKDDRQYLIDMINDLAPTLKKYQDPESGTWYQVTDKAGARGNYLEASGSSMFTYFFAKAILKGYLPESWLPVAKKSYQGLLNEFVRVHNDGSISLTSNCEVAGLGFGRDGSYRYYMSEPVVDDDLKGVGPFIMAGVEMHKLLNRYN